MATHDAAIAIEEGGVQDSGQVDPPPSGGCAPAPSASWATWAPADKDAVGTSLGTSRLWFTLAQGIITEVYHPRPDIPQLKDLGFIVADEKGAWVELRRLGQYSVTWLEDRIPAITVVHRHDLFGLTLRICADPHRDVLLVDFELVSSAKLSLYVLAAPRLGADALQNRAWVADWVGRPVIWAEQGPFGLALSAVDRDRYPALWRRSVGCVGESDGWQDFARHGRLHHRYGEAGPGEVALAGKLASAGTLALGMSSSRESAATLALQSLAAGFDAAWEDCANGWRRWLNAIPRHGSLEARLDSASLKMLHRSATVLKIHEDRTFPGAMVASLSVPWGESSRSQGGYHLVWARDLVEAAGAFVALGCLTEAQNILVYLIGTQQSDGHWLQNQWLGGKPFWQGIQLDETAFPVLLASALADRNALQGIAVTEMVRRAVTFIAREGPVTGQDRWEEDSGISTFTLTVIIAALVEGSRFLSPRASKCALMLADYWNAKLEEWTYASDTALARTLGVPGYYMRTAPEEVMTHEGAKHRPLRAKNQAQPIDTAADERLAIDCLQLARYGLRAWNDPAMLASVKAIDSLLRTETPNGPVWHRYNGDGYGEHSDGAPFDGWGAGRGWPLLTGERGHLALLASGDASCYLHSMTRMVGVGGLLPEQVWDSARIEDRHLYPGKPTGSAMPLVWAHAEFIKLALSMDQGIPIDRPAHTWNRYRNRRPTPDFALWQPRQRIRRLSVGQELRLLLPEQGRVHWGIGDWQEPADVDTEDLELAHLARLPTRELPPGTIINFTIYWICAAKWSGEHCQVLVSESSANQSVQQGLEHQAR